MSPAQTHHLTFQTQRVRKRYVSFERGEPDREWIALQLLAEHAPGLAPEPIGRETIDGAPVVVMSRLLGTPLGDRRLSARQLDALAVALRRLFDVPPAAIHASGLGERVHGPRAFRRSVSTWAEGPFDVTGCGHPEMVSAALDAGRTWLGSPDAIPEEILDPVLGQADGNLANVLWDGERCRLVDFEDCGVSDPAYELADLVEHVSGRLGRLLDPDAVVAAVGLTPGQVGRWSAYRRLMAMFWLVMLMPGNPGFDRNPRGATENQARHVLELLSAD